MVWPAAVRAARTTAAASMSVWLAIRSRRRSTMSARAPAGTPTRNTGSMVAVWTRATWNAEPPRDPISQTAPTFCIQVPMFEIS